MPDAGFPESTGPAKLGKVLKDISALESDNVRRYRAWGRRDLQGDFLAGDDDGYGRVLSMDSPQHSAQHCRVCKTHEAPTYE